MDYQALKALIETHPQWPSADDATLTTWVNEEVVVVDKATLPAVDVLGTIMANRGEWGALTDAERGEVRDILAVCSATGVPTTAGEPIRAALVTILGNATKSALAALIPHNISRAENAGLPGAVREGDVQFARTT